MFGSPKSNQLQYNVHSVTWFWWPNDNKLWYKHAALDNLFFFWRNSPQWARASSFTKFLYHTQRRTTVGRTPPDELSTRRRDPYLAKDNTHDRHQCPRRDSIPTISASERSQTYALDRAAAGTCLEIIIIIIIIITIITLLMIFSPLRTMVTDVRT
jgi:hypothetical protein